VFTVVRILTVATSHAATIVGRHRDHQRVAPAAQVLHFGRDLIPHDLIGPHMKA